MSLIQMTEEDFRSHCNDYNGLCTQCAAIRYGDTEPDAEEYPCAECGENCVVGMENALVMELIEII